MRDYRSRLRRAGLALTSCVTVVLSALLSTVLGVPAASAAGGATAPPASPSPPPAGAPAASVRVRPDVIRLPGAATRAPGTTAECERKQGIACFGPGQLRAAYRLPPLYALGITGAGETIMIVDSFGSPTIRRDLAVFDRQYGYPAPPKFTVIAPAGAIPAFDPASTDMTQWAGETTLDVEYAHALAPGASILLVETPVAETEGVTGFPQIVRAEEYALARYPVAVISQSFSATEATFTGGAQLGPLRGAYEEAALRHVTVLAASGDAGATDYQPDQTAFYPRRVTSWPDSDPLVTAVGGTALRQRGGGYAFSAWNDTYDSAWNQYADGSAGPAPAATGGGLSEFFARPSYQDGVQAVVGARRGVPDIAMSAACDGAVPVYSSYQPGQAGWSLTCGTSEATPEFAAVVALADQVAGRPLGNINPAIYRLAARHAPGIVDVTTGNNTVSFNQDTGRQQVTVHGYPAGPGYDLVTGVGTVDAASFVPELAAASWSCRVPPGLLEVNAPGGGGPLTVAGLRLAKGPARPPG